MSGWTKKGANHEINHAFDAGAVGSAHHSGRAAKYCRRLPVTQVTYQWSDNDVNLAAEMMDASGAKKVRLGLNDGVHAIGSCRIGNDAKTSVVKSQKATFMPSASARSF